MERLGQRILKLVPQYRERVWGGQRLVAAGERRPAAGDRPNDPAAAAKPIGEAWIAYGPSVVAEGPLAGRTLDQLIDVNASELLGVEAAARYGQRFPLLIKLL